LRFPPVLVSYIFTQPAKEAVQDVWTSTDPVDRSLISVPGRTRQAAVDTVESLAHIRQNFEIDNLRLGDFEVRPAPVSP
jgi:hypothetical protein